METHARAKSSASCDNNTHLLCAAPMQRTFCTDQNSSLKAPPPPPSHRQATNMRHKWTRRAHNGGGRRQQQEGRTMRATRSSQAESEGQARARESFSSSGYKVKIKAQRNELDWKSSKHDCSGHWFTTLTGCRPLNQLRFFRLVRAEKKTDRSARQRRAHAFLLSLCLLASRQGESLCRLYWCVANLPSLKGRNSAQNVDCASTQVAQIKNINCTHILYTSCNCFTR